MSGAFPQRPQLRLEAEQYGRLRFQMLERDGWKCQHCGRRDQLQIHHLVRRSQSGADCEENLIALCSNCHRSLHLKGT
jgi:5-methylcytosine-specific restriction endonuclease McrA